MEISLPNSLTSAVRGKNKPGFWWRDWNCGPMQLDPRTLLMTLTISTALLGFYLVFYQATRKTYTGFRMWVFGTVLMGIGALLLAFRGEVPTGLSIVLGNVAYPAGGVFLLLGTKRFLELPSPGKTLWAIPLITMLGLSFFYWVYDLAAIRGMVMSLGLASVGLPTAWLLWRHAPDSSKALYYFTSFAMAIANIALPARSLIWWIVDPEVQLLTQHAFQTIYLFIAMFAQITWTFGFVMMNSQRLEDDLRQSRSDLSEANQYLEKALKEVRQLGGLLPICSNCKKIRDSEDYWHQVEVYISSHSDARFSHSICPDCIKELYPDLCDDDDV
jgi:hypothetical protein